MVLTVPLDLGLVANNKNLKSLKLYQTKVLNFSKQIAIEFLALCFCLYRCQWKLMRSRNKKTAKNAVDFGVGKVILILLAELLHFMWDLP